MKRTITLIALTAAFVSAWADDVTFTIDPASGSQLEQISSFDITFSCPMKVDSPNSATLLRDGHRVDAKVSCTVGDDKHTVQYKVDPPQTLEGTYKFKYLDWEVCPTQKDVYTPYIDLVYYIGEPKELEPVVTSNPEIGSSSSYIAEILLKFENISTLQIDNSKSVYLTDGVDQYPYQLTDESSQSDFMVLASPVVGDAIYNTPGEYWLVVEEGALILDGKDWCSRLEYGVESRLEVVSVVPAEGLTTVEMLENITLTFNFEISSITSYMVQALQIYRSEDNSLLESVGGYIPEIDASDRRVVHLISDGEIEITESGSYSLQLPPTLFNADGLRNLAMSINYTVDLDGIVTLTSDSRYDVFTLGGVKVVSAGNAAALRSLAPGIYIVNGNPTLIR